MSNKLLLLNNNYDSDNAVRNHDDGGGVFAVESLLLHEPF
jgi:hypothetical protein